MTFIHADDSPNGKPLVAVANEVSGTTTIYEVALDDTPSSFQLQILHASDLEGGIDAISAAPNFAAIEAQLESEFENSITISAGDNYISGPFFNAASDSSFNSIFVDLYNEFFDLVDENGVPDTDIDGDGELDFFAEIDNFSGRVDISIMNLIGFDASALGNHEFDLGPDFIENIINYDPGNPGGTTNLLNLLQEVDWPGIQFPYLSANLDFSVSSDLADLFTNQILLSTDFETDLSHGARRRAGAAEDRAVDHHRRQRRRSRRHRRDHAAARLDLLAGAGWRERQCSRRPERYVGAGRDPAGRDRPTDRPGREQDHPDQPPPAVPA